MMYLTISQNWLFSPLARRIYFICALSDIVLLATRIGAVAAIHVSGTSPIPTATESIIRILLFPEVLGSAVLFVGMTYCWLGFGASYEKKLLWLLLLKLFLVVMPFYYFIYYRPLASSKTEESTALNPVV